MADSNKRLVVELALVAPTENKRAAKQAGDEAARAQERIRLDHEKSQRDQERATERRLKAEQRMQQRQARELQRQYQEAAREEDRQHARHRERQRSMALQNQKRLQDDSRELQESIRGRERVEATAQAKSIAGYKAMEKGIRQVAMGTTHVIRGFALIGASSEEDLEKAIRQFAKIEAGLQIVSGAAHIGSGLSKVSKGASAMRSVGVVGALGGAAGGAGAATAIGTLTAAALAAAVALKGLQESAQGRGGAPGSVGDKFFGMMQMLEGVGFGRGVKIESWQRATQIRKGSARMASIQADRVSQFEREQAEIEDRDFQNRLGGIRVGAREDIAGTRARFGRGGVQADLLENRARLGIARSNNLPGAMERVVALEQQRAELLQRAAQEQIRGVEEHIQGLERVREKQQSLIDREKDRYANLEDRLGTMTAPELGQTARDFAKFKSGGQLNPEETKRLQGLGIVDEELRQRNRTRLQGIAGIDPILEHQQQRIRSAEVEARKIDVQIAQQMSVKVQIEQNAQAVADQIANALLPLMNRVAEETIREMQKQRERAFKGQNIHAGSAIGSG